MDRRNFLVSSLLSSVAISSVSRTGALLAASFQDPDTLPDALRQQLMHDPLRPQFHLLPKANWMNDPCAPRYHRGLYHLFYQYNPGAAVWGDMHWAHATSPDMIQWQHQPIALAPTPGYPDAAGCFTGSVLPGMATPTIIYTGVVRCPTDQETVRGEGLREVQCLATSTDPELRTWTKLEKPAVSAPPPGLKVTGFRDPCPWKDGETWYLIVGSGSSKVGGAVLLYRSSNGLAWEYLHPLARGKWNDGTQVNPVDTGEMWECPDFFPLGDKHVLLYSTERKVFWEVGTLDRQAMLFHSETRGLLDHGHYYAMKSMEDAKARRILWGWVTEGRSEDEMKKAGWSGAMALPRVLTIGSDNTLRMAVPPEFATLHEKTHTLAAPHTAADLPAKVSKMPIERRAGMIAYSFKPGASACALELRSNGAQLLSIAYDGAQPSLAIGDATLALTPSPGGLSTVQVWIDGSVVEVFVDNKEALTVRSYTGSGDIEVAWTGAADALTQLSVSGVRPISADRLTS